MGLRHLGWEAGLGSSASAARETVEMIPVYGVRRGQTRGENPEEEQYLLQRRTNYSAGHGWPTAVLRMAFALTDGCRAHHSLGFASAWNPKIFTVWSPRKFTDPDSGRGTGAFRGKAVRVTVRIRRAVTSAGKDRALGWGDGHAGVVSAGADTSILLQGLNGSKKYFKRKLRI